MSYDSNRALAVKQVLKVLDRLTFSIATNKPFRWFIGTDYGVYAVYAPQVITTPEGCVFATAHVIVRENGPVYASYERHDG